MPALLSPANTDHHKVVIVGAGAAGIATASSLISRDPSLDVALIDPADVHYYQPGWTMVGAGVFKAPSTARTMASTIPRGVRWVKARVQGFDPLGQLVMLEGGRAISYEQLIVCPGLTLDWAAIEGLCETLGRNGVTSNYRYDLAPYTWELVQKLKQGRAVFSQPPMPIKCAGAPQKALYLSCDHWLRNGHLGAVKASFFNAGAVLFGVADYVPALMKYIEKYAVDLNFSHRLVAVDGPNKRATFVRTLPDGSSETRIEAFDMLHVVPPQVAPAFIRESPLADNAGWVDVDPHTLRHRKYTNIHALGDVANTSNAKTAAAARKQAPVVANNVLVALGRLPTLAQYDGYGSCPLTVERGKIVLAEFTYGGKLAPSFPSWLLDGRKPTRLAWLLKAQALPPLYWQGMLKGREWLARPQLVVEGWAVIEHQLLGAGLGAIIGAVLALTGAGGGILAVPLLVFGLGLSMVEAAPVGLLAVGMAAAVGAVLGLRQGLVRYRAALFIALIGVAAAPFGLMLAHRLPNTPLQLVFAGVLVYACLRIWRKAAKDLRGEANDAHRYIEPCVLNPLQGRLRWTLPCARALAFTGALSGLLSGLLGVGGGFVIIPALNRYTNLRMASIVSTSLAVIALVSTGSVVSASLAGVMHWQVGAPFASGAVLGLLLARPLAARLAGPRLQQMFAVAGWTAALLLAGKALLG